MRRSIKQIFDRTIFLKRFALFIGTVISAVFVYQVLLRFTREDNLVFGGILLWLLTAYVILPRIHRILTKIYLPNYFIGRSRTGDGLLSDPVNLAVIGSEKELIKTMKKADWIVADELTWKTTLKMMHASVLHRPYPNAPFSSLYLFSKKQDLGFQQSVGNNTKKRHHVRFWKCPDGWLLPGGMRADWVGAATFDKRVGFSVYTFQFTHKIEENIDEERDYVIKTIKDTSPQVRIEVVEEYSTGYHTKNGGGDTIKTDGALPFIYLGDKK